MTCIKLDGYYISPDDAGITPADWLKREFWEYYHKQGEDLDDTLACPLTLEYEQYLVGMVWWCKEDAWQHLCHNWSSDGIKNVGINGKCSPINSQKSHKLIDDYSIVARVEYPDDWEKRPFDPAILYNINGGFMKIKSFMKNKLIIANRFRQ